MSKGRCSFNKATCKRLAAEVRSEIDLSPMDALDPWRLAALYGVKVIPLSTLAIGAEIRDHFSVARPDMFSGALVPIGKGAVIVENDSHPSVRRRSTLGHELAHVFGEHKFATSLVNERGCRPDARGGGCGDRRRTSRPIRGRQAPRPPQGNKRGGGAPVRCQR